MGRGAVNEEEHRGEGCPAEFRLDPEIQRVWLVRTVWSGGERLGSVERGGRWGMRMGIEDEVLTVKSGSSDCVNWPLGGNMR